MPGVFKYLRDENCHGISIVMGIGVYGLGEVLGGSLGILTVNNRGLEQFGQTLDNQSIKRDRLIGIGFVLDFVEFISFTFGDKEMILVIEAPEEDDEDLEEDPADYPADRDDDDEEEEEPFGDDAEDEDEEEEEHPAPADSVPPIHRMTARISIRDEPSISLPPREEVERLLALTTPPLTPLSSPLPHIPSPPFPASPPASPISVLPASPPASPIRPLGY
ncbi:hypothetical protein Tco_0373789 [Tanacetum coccineum]